MEPEKDKQGAESPTESQQTVSDDDEIDYSVKPEFYDSDLDEKDELWVNKKRKGRTSDAVLSCPACFTTLCLECQRHEKYVTQYRAIFVVNCKIKREEILRQANRRQGKGKNQKDSGASEVGQAGGETFKPVCCLVCATEVGIIDEDEIHYDIQMVDEALAVQGDGFTEVKKKKGPGRPAADKGNKPEVPPSRLTRKEILRKKGSQ
ncbi:hypothetical protein NE237_007035 [Protea cynaroides]|uniref:E2F-associated phosphoprotein n=1 Tax=Protea cynaroides TaxID=273540 RepID=A0A9Q0KP80_9MAGN|nr:hypothetical protein NE237_007035 [Protea cynaroides]